jgi:heme/copper-type cytochrome/quinol oxidase subunit 2
MDRRSRRRRAGLGADPLVRGGLPSQEDDVGLPEQLRYNVPIEILYTVVPLFMITALFYYTAARRVGPAGHLPEA